MGPVGATMWGNHKNTTQAGESHNHYMRLDNTTEEFTTVGAINHGGAAVLGANKGCWCHLCNWNMWPHLLQHRGIMGKLILLSVLGGLFISLFSVRLQFAVGSFRLPKQSTRH